MKLPAKVIYTCKAIAQLSVSYDSKNPVRIQDISEAQSIPKKFLVQLLIRLKNAGIVNSSRGVSGGYALAKAPSKLTLAEVVRAIDDNIITIAPASTRNNKKIDKLFQAVWEEINSDIVSKLENITFADIATKLKNQELTYHI